ncbi:MAG TPA: class II glutamine amidotransferase [Planctomycetaceae bacterium]|jgi:predicted glutamine amidotransferase|nr:class II glutamine amidotransferase [Planctomycetaceae bacterium]
MCRWLAYHGPAIRLEDILFRTEHSLIDQSLSSLSKETATNGDGFGVGWYGNRTKPGLFRSIRPAWNDFNLHELAAHITSPLFLAHVRATSKATVQETNCHPFRYSRWLFVHNGEIEEIERFRRDLLFQVAPQFFPHIQGTTDSELMFYLALTLGLEDDPIGGLERMAGLVEKVAGTQGVAQALWMTLGLSDGQRMYAVRYASDSDAPTLYHTADTEHLYRLNKTLRTQSPQPIRLIVSEPIGNVAEAWQEIPQNTAVSFIDGQFEQQPFRPTPPPA